MIEFIYKSHHNLIIKIILILYNYFLNMLNLYKKVVIFLKYLLKDTLKSKNEVKFEKFKIF